MEIVYAALVFLFGLAIGSFLNVCIFRIPNKESIVTGRSHCTSCGHAIRPYDLIPVFSWLFLRGRCRDCGAKISPVYPAVELLNALLWLAAYLLYGFHPFFFVCAAFLPALIVVSFIDAAHREIPDRINLYILIIGCLAMIFSRETSIPERLIGFIAVSLPLLVAAVVSKGGMGPGDIKLAAVAGLVVGWKLALFALLVGSVAGAVFGLAYAAATRKGLKAAIPFGPFLSAGFCLAALCGGRLIAWYIAAVVR